LSWDLGENGNVPVGITTERDVIRHIAQDIASSRSDVKKLMSRPLITISLNASMKDALMIMISKNIRHIVVLDEKGALAGIVADKDIYRAIARDESLIAGLISDEMLLEHAERLEQQWVYKLGEILHRRIANGDSLEKHKITESG
jgi:signal-transduction protein with cAMP-binding, CBS, and nucleotidyltransferase domain